MRRRKFREIVYFVFTAGYGVAILISGLASACLKADPSNLQGFWAFFVSPLKWTQDRAWIILMVLAVYILVAEVVRKTMGPPWVWRAIHNLLDIIQEYAFRDHADAMLHDHRVTLFKYVKWRVCFRRWPWSGWLLPVERSGHTTRSKVAIFRAPDDAAHAEGIAGAAWASRGAVPVLGLPDLEHDSTDENIRAYAEKTFVSEEWVKKYLAAGKPLALSFVGVPVEVNGKRWGVIVLDSKSDIHSGPTVLRLYTLFSRMLGELLERT